MRKEVEKENKVSFLNSTAIYGLAFMIAGFTPFMLLPVLTRELTTEEFGIVTSFLIYVAFIGSFSGLGVNGYLPVRYFKDNKHEFSIKVFTGLSVVVFSHLFALPLVIAFFFSGIDTGLKFFVLCFSVLISLVQSFNVIFLAISQASSKPMQYLKIRALQAVIEILLFFFLLKFFFHDEYSRIFSYALAVSFAALLGFIYVNINNQVTYHFRAKGMKEILKFGLPLMPHIMAGAGIMFAERMIILSVLGTAALGIYMAGMQMGMAMLLVIEPVNKTFAPWLFGQLKENRPGMRFKIVKATYAYFLGLIMFGVILAYALYVLFDIIVGSEFVSGKDIVPYIIFGFVFQGLYYAVTNYIFYSEKTAALSKVTFAVSTLGVIMSVFFIRQYGIQGAGYGFVLTNFLLFVCVWILSNRVVPMPWLLQEKQG